MKVPVAAASKHGATQQIAEAIGEELTARELDVTVAPVEDVTSITEYDAVIIGSAIYLGRWMKPARQFATDHAAELASRPVWVYPSGPIPDRNRRRTTPLTEGRRRDRERHPRPGTPALFRQARPQAPEPPRARPRADGQAAGR